MIFVMKEVDKMEINELQTPVDILEFMKEHIQFGWIDINGKKHIKTMKGFRELYRISSIEETLNSGIGVCIEQVELMHYLFNRLNIKNKMFCCRVYEPDDFCNVEEDEHMHCILLYYIDHIVYQIEYPNGDRMGIYEYSSEEEALQEIIDYYVNFRGGKASPTTEYYETKAGLSFQEFNSYINHIEKDIANKGVEEF